MMSEGAPTQSSGGLGLHSFPHYTYHTNLFVLRTAVSSNGELAKMDSASKELHLAAGCPPLSLCSVAGEVEAVLKSFGASHISSLWCDDVPYFQVVSLYPF